MPRPNSFALVAAVALLSQAAHADTFAKVYFDTKSGRLVVTMLYRGTNPNHKFSLKWSECRADQAGNLPGVTAEVLDDQWDDAEQQAYSLRSAPRFFYTLTIPK